MAANINSFASLRRPAWHGLGTVIDAPLSGFDFQKVAGLDWNVYDAPIYTPSRIVADGIIGGVELEDQKIIMRDDNFQPLGIVGKDYTSVQNSELFDFVSRLGEFDLDMTIETAGALGKGETVWVLVKMNSMKIALGNDVMDSYLAICNGHIGNMATCIFPTTTRIVCQNTLRMAIKEKNGKVGLSKGWAIRHTSNIHERIAQARKSIEETVLEYSTTQEAISRMADAKASDDFILDLIRETFGEKKEDTSKRGETLTENRNKAIFANLESPTSKGLDTEGSIWSALNAVTEYLDHDSIIRSNNKQEARFQNNLIDGPSTKAKAKAWDYAYSVAMA